VYHAPYDSQFSLVCMDESNKQLVGEVHAPLPLAPGSSQIIDHENVRDGVADIFLEVEPLHGRCHAEITEQRTRKDWTMFVKGVLDECYPQAKKVRLVMDNLNTHSAASHYEAFEPEEVRRLARRLEIHYTPKHGSWLNVAEIELSALSGQCLNRRIPAIELMRKEVVSWATGSEQPKCHHRLALHNRGCPHQTETPLSEITSDTRYKVTDSQSFWSRSSVQTVFLDRDGVLNEKMPEGSFVSDWVHFHILPGVVEAIGRLNRAGLRVIVVSNQRGIALGLYSTSDVEIIHRNFQAVLRAQGAHVDGFYYCPHEKHQCNCRKPLSGLFERAVIEFPEITARNSVMIGDSLSDIEFGQRLGMLTVFVDGDPTRQKPGIEAAQKLANLHFRSLFEAVDHLTV
jgi:histidinol-phosphate phosphatase family protein